MKIQLKKIHFSEKLSQETNAYSAELYVDGKPLAICSNDGWGGSDLQLPHPKSGLNNAQLQSRLADVNAYLAANNPPLDGFGGSPIPYDLELFCGAAVEKHAAEKWAKGQLARNIIIKDESGALRVLGFKGKPTKARKVELAVNKYGSANVLNAMDKAEAIKLLLEA